MLLNYLKQDFNLKYISVFILPLRVYIRYPATAFQRPVFFFFVELITACSEEQS